MALFDEQFIGCNGQLPYTQSMKKYFYGKAALVHHGFPYFKGAPLSYPDHGLFDEFHVSPEYLVFTDKSFYHPVGSNIHTCKNFKAKKYVSGVSSTPPLTFLQLASEFSLYQLILLGLLLCADRGLCDVAELRRCADDLPGFRGRPQAKRALQHIADGARSIMEAKLYMALSLPQKLGGCGIAGILLNQKIYCPKHRLYFIPDLYIPEHNLMIEYDSYLHHNNSTSFSDDADRAAILESEGYSVISVKPKQILNLQSYSTLIYNIHKRIGKQFRIRSMKYYSGFVNLWNLIQNHTPFATSQRHSQRYDLVKLHEVPRLPCVDAKYEQYVRSWKKEKRKWAKLGIKV